MKATTKQTAVDFLREKLTYVFVNDKSFNDLFEQAKAMEKEQAQKMYEFASWERFHNGHGQTFEQYWNKTFKSQ